jgi:hypothetical protein
MMIWYLDALREYVFAGATASESVEGAALSLVSLYRSHGIPANADPVAGLSLIANTRAHLLLGGPKLTPDTRNQLEECLKAMEQELLLLR